MSDDETRPIGPDAPPPPPPAAAGPPHGAVAAPEAPTVRETPAHPAYATPLPAGYPGHDPSYAAAQRPRFADQVLGMRAVIAVAIACLLIGGLSGFLLGRATAGDDGDRFGGPGGGFFQQRGGTFPDGGNGAPNQQFGPG